LLNIGLLRPPIASGGKNDGIMDEEPDLFGVFGAVPLSNGGACGIGNDGLNGN